MRTERGGRISPRAGWRERNTVRGGYGTQDKIAIEEASEFFLVACGRVQLSFRPGDRMMDIRTLLLRERD